MGFSPDLEVEENPGALSVVANTVMPSISDGQCQNGLLHSARLEQIYDELPNMGKGNHHLLDYALFRTNVRINVNERIEAF